jgi:uncharacterized protein
LDAIGFYLSIPFIDSVQMKFHPDVILVPYIKSYGSGWIEVGDARLTGSFVLTATGEQFDWQCAHFDDLTAGHFERIAALKPELVIFGSGNRIRFPTPSLTMSLINAQIGIETMDTQAACRTYNVLASEGRKVALALLQD